jgi:hypothetical protein
MHLRRKLPCKNINLINNDNIGNVKLDENPILSETVNNTVFEKFVLLETVLQNNKKIDDLKSNFLVIINKYKIKVVIN